MPFWLTFIFATIFSISDILSIIVSLMISPSGGINLGKIYQKHITFLGNQPTAVAFKSGIMEHSGMPDLNDAVVGLR